MFLEKNHKKGYNIGITLLERSLSDIVILTERSDEGSRAESLCYHLVRLHSREIVNKFTFRSLARTLCDHLIRLHSQRNCKQVYILLVGTNFARDVSEMLHEVQHDKLRLGQTSILLHGSPANFRRAASQLLGGDSLKHVITSSHIAPYHPAPPRCV